MNVRKKLAISLALVLAAPAIAGDPRSIGPHKELACLVLTADSKTLVTGGWDKTVRLWDTTKGTETKKLEHGDAVLGLALSPEGKTLATACNDRVVRVFDLATGKKTLDLEKHGASVETVAYSSDGKRLASGSNDMTARLYDAATGKKHVVLMGHKRAVRAVVFAPDGKTIATGSGDETVRVWDTATGKELRSYEGHKGRVTALTFSRDGKWLASGCSDGVVRVWDAGTEGEPASSLAPEEDRDMVNGLAFSPDGNTIAIATQKHTLLRERASGKTVARFEVASFPNALAVVFAKDGKSVWVGTGDGLVRVHEVK